ncbi:FAD-dependent oxidoreductase [Kitasatospora sp. NPDC096147]|uniref:FAD-dependent oxidoreductase n=1 Tax=Kitasatospora sp. NPDC096147 TaxID=3364093 RepID=UPI00382C20C6
MDLHRDVLVAGGGPAGAATALALAGRGCSVLLADAGGGPGKPGESLPSVARVLLGDLGAGELPLAEGHLPCYAHQSAWGSAALASTDYIRDPRGPGWHLDRARFDRALRAAAGRAGAQLAERTTVRSATRRPEGGWTVTLQGGGTLRQVHCQWLVDAAGRRRAVAGRLPAARQRTDRLVAVRLELEPAAGGAPVGTSLLEAAPDGWWYTAPMPGGRRLLGYFTDADLAAPTGLAAFRRLLDRTTHVARLAAAHPPAPDVPPRRAPAHSAQLDTPLGPGWLAVGDAATAFDPLSAQGVLTALHTGATAGHALASHLDGDRTALTAYQENLDALRAAYRRNRHAVYAQERRWPDRPFWQRRHTSAAPGAGDPYGPRTA